MDNEFDVFVGYFNTGHSRKTVGKYLFYRCPAARRIAIRSRRVGGSGRVYCCCLTFASNFRARQAIKVLSSSSFDGMQLIARTWIERSAFNERRDINWRTKPWKGEERRKGERRYYRHARPQPSANRAPFVDRDEVKREAKVRPELEQHSETVQLTPSELSSLQGSGRSYSLLETELQEFGIFVTDENPDADRRALDET